MEFIGLAVIAAVVVVEFRELARHNGGYPSIESPDELCETTILETNETNETNDTPLQDASV